MLKQECAIAMPYIVAGWDRIGSGSRAFATQNTVSPTTVPMTLKDRWTSAARLAFLLVPTEERSAVTQVPMFWPMMMGIAAP